MQIFADRVHIHNIRIPFNNQYLTRARIEASKQLLAAVDRTIPQIASLLRFCGQIYFTLVFRRQAGLTPGDYRNKNLR